MVNQLPIKVQKLIIGSSDLMTIAYGNKVYFYLSKENKQTRTKIEAIMKTHVPDREYEIKVVGKIVASPAT